MKHLISILLLGLTIAGWSAEQNPNYAFSKVVDMNYEQAIEKVTADLKSEGFGVITEIDVAATMKEKLNTSMQPYKILGACNPQFAYEAIQAEIQVGLFLPCNVIVYVNDNGKTVVSAVDPVAMMAAVKNETLLQTAQEVRAKLKAVIERL
jgi:uncharacterized protein (DUF302 family)